MSDAPRVYLTDLYAYNCGALHGKWVDATDEDELKEAGQAILASSPYPGGEELFITDYGNFCGVRIDEYDPLSKVAKIGAAIDEHGERAAAFLQTAISDVLGKLDEIDDYFAGEFESEDGYRKEMYTEFVLEQFKHALKEADRHNYYPHGGSLSDTFENHIEDHIDVEQASQGMDDGVTIIQVNDTYYVFQNEI